MNFDFIKTAYNSINRLVSKSISTNEVSATRLQSYLILGPIQIMVAVVVLIEMTHFIVHMCTSAEYVLSNEFIITFGMILAHHLSILFSRTKSQSMKEIKDGHDDTAAETPVPEKPKDEVPG